MSVYIHALEYLEHGFIPLGTTTHCIAGNPLKSWQFLQCPKYLHDVAIYVCSSS